MLNIVLIPLRGGSKSIPKKNIKPIGGKPLCFWTINSALNSSKVNTVFVSTDCNEISNTVKGLFTQELKEKKLIIEMRSAELATDLTSTEEVILDFTSSKEFSNFGLIQATSPLISPNDIDNAFKKLSEGFDSALGVTRIKRFFWSEDGTPINYDYTSRPRRQDFSGTLVENGSIYTTTKESLVNTQNRIGGKIGLVEMTPETFIEIDEPEDFLVLEKLIEKKNFSLRFKNIKGAVFDIDGTLTDGGMYYNESGEELKKFNTKDFKGIELLRTANIKVGIITAESSERVHARMEKIGFPKEDYFHGVKDKLPVLKEWAESNGLNLKDIAYFGDDLGDLECMQHVGASFSPKDATQKVKSIASYTSEKEAGRGFVRDVIDKILDAQWDG